MDRRDYDTVVEWIRANPVLVNATWRELMSAVDAFIVESILPRLRDVAFHAGYEISVSWDRTIRGGAHEVVDLAPLLFRLKFYGPLRADEALRRSVHLINDGSAIAWGQANEIDMAAGSVLRLAEEVMTAADFEAFMKRHHYTFEHVAAELGVSKRLAEHYAAGRAIPRSIAMACELIDRKTGQVRARQADGESHPAETEMSTALIETR